MHRVSVSALATVYTVCICWRVAACSSNELKRLKTMLFIERGYDRHIRPVINQSDSIQVGVLMGVQTIVAYDTTSGLLETHGYILAHWTDEHLVWDAADFSDISFIFFPSDDIWTPNLIQMYGNSNDVEVTELTVDSDGNVLWLLVGKLRTYCEVGVRYYPLDKHTCVFYVYSSYLLSEMRLYALASSVDIEYLHRHGEWDIVNSSATIQTFPFKYYTEPSDFFEGSLYLDRRSTFVMIHKGIPLLLMTVSTFSVHAVPLVSGERISFTVTLFLAFVFWQATISEDLPKESTQVTLVSIVMSVSMVCSTLAMISSVILCRMSVEQIRPIPTYLRKLVERRIQKQAGNGAMLSNDGKGDVVSETEETSEVSQNGTEREITWFLVADSIDTILFYVVFTVEAIIFMIFLVMFCIYEL